MKYSTFLAVVLLLTACNSNEGKKIREESMPAIDDFFSQIEKQDYVGALNHLLGPNPNIRPRDSSALNLRKQFAEISQYSGAYRGKSLISTKIIHDDLAAFGYLVKYDKKFYRFIFVFYNNGISTKIYKFSFDDNAESELEESMKLYF